MSNETKREVFDDALAYAPVGREYDPVNDDEAGDLRSCLSARYSAALPDDLPVIPKAVGEYIQEHKAMHDSLAFALTSRLTPNEVYEWMCTVTGDSDTELSQIEYVKKQDTFALAWVLGVWRVKETGEIMKLEEED
ncbi:DUF1642 domain-containing protein [Lacticaseibacillus paracasei subsp. paracasei]|uniref:DUF1642 domain-containing protein n=1 Tax=Lacticaseibacillus paracasei TaxID=1597 RepID=UPI001F15B8E4|nr:DUF1642 domain-containing protein [Lacticaseibacillus paracasei]UJS06791.1 DUF1642 domain-containing protein [Lacticaseibacillus paracasei subsp. paracasei]